MSTPADTRPVADLSDRELVHAYDAATRAGDFSNLVVALQHWEDTDELHVEMARRELDASDPGWWA